MKKIGSSTIRSCRVDIMRADLVQPFRTALGEHRSLENLIFKIVLADKTVGLGEAAVATHISGESFQDTHTQLQQAAAMLQGRDVTNCAAISRDMHEAFSTSPSVLAAVETAVMDAVARHRKIPLWRLFGRRCRLLQTDITIVIADLKETEASVKRFYRQGFRAFKVKVGQDFDLDVKRMALTARVARNSSLILDANQGYNAKEMLAFLKEMEKADVKIDLIEQPVPRSDWEGLKRVTRATDIPVCADESVRTWEDAQRAIKEKAVDAINIKIMKHGLLGAHRIAQLARRSKMSLMIGGMMETSLAMTASAHLAAGMGCFSYIDLDTPFFIKNEPVRGGGLSRRGVYDLSKIRSGIGVSINR